MTVTAAGDKATEDGWRRTELRMNVAGTENPGLMALRGWFDDCAGFMQPCTWPSSESPLHVTQWQSLVR
jgi:hypothetical protein